MTEDPTKEACHRNSKLCCCYHFLRHFPTGISLFSFCLFFGYTKSSSIFFPYLLGFFLPPTGAIIFSVPQRERESGADKVSRRSSPFTAEFIAPVARLYKEAGNGTAHTTVALFCIFSSIFCSFFCSKQDSTGGVF